MPTAVLELVVFLLIGSVCGQEQAVVDYGIRDGLPSAYVSCLARTGDERIWIGHSSGVSVYDDRLLENLGVEDGLLGQNPSGIVSSAEGHVWASFPQEVIQSINREGEVATVPDPHGLLVRDHVAFLHILEAGRQVVAAGAQGYYLVDRTAVTGPRFPAEGSSGAVTTTLDLGEGRGLLAIQDGVFVLDETGSEPVTLPRVDSGQYPVMLMAEGRENVLWLLGPDGRLEPCEAVAGCSYWEFARSAEPFYACRVSVDREGVVWIASGSGLLRFQTGEFEVLAEDTGLSNSFIDLLLHRDPVLWVATESGLDKISRRGFRNYRRQKDFPVNSVWSIEELPDGSVWVGTNSGITGYLLPHLGLACLGRKKRRLDEVDNPPIASAPKIDAGRSADDLGPLRSQRLPHWAGVEWRTAGSSLEAIIHFSVLGRSLQVVARPAIYRPSRPRESALYQCLDHHWEEFQQGYSPLYEKDYGPIRPVVEKKVERFLECGILRHGFARIRCGHCREEYWPAFSRKTRYFWPERSLSPLPSPLPSRPKTVPFHFG